MSHTSLLYDPTENQDGQADNLYSDDYDWSALITSQPVDLNGFVDLTGTRATRTNEPDQFTSLFHDLTSNASTSTSHSGERATKRRRLVNNDASIDITAAEYSEETSRANPVSAGSDFTFGSLDFRQDPVLSFQHSEPACPRSHPESNPDTAEVIPMGQQPARRQQSFATQGFSTSMGGNASQSSAVENHRLPPHSNHQTSYSAADLFDDHQLTTTARSTQNPEADTGDLEAIDLTAVTDTTSLRQREQLDDEARRIRREASVRIEAKRQANKAVLKSALKQQEVSSKAPRSGNSSSKSSFAVNSYGDGRAMKHGGLGAMQCVICMDDFTDMTATHCGHLFCHTCINEHLVTAEVSRGWPGTKALCPFCRTAIVRKPKNAKEKMKGIVPLLYKTKNRFNGAAGENDKQREVEKVD